MSSNQPTIRARGQRLIPSTFIHKKSTNQLSDGKEKCEDVSVSKKRTKISLSDFLDRKLQKTSNQAKLVQGKERPFLSPVTSVGADQKTEGPELNGFIDVLEQFKHNKDNENNTSSNLEDEVQCSNLIHPTEDSQTQDLSKKRSPFGGKPPAPKGLVILGGDPTPKQTRYQKPFIRNEKPLPNYNHYASGSGWWDSDMEGIDNAEVGFNENEVWEGVGSSTIGGLDWH